MSDHATNLAARLLRVADEDPGRTAVVQGDRSLSYAEFAERVGHAAATFAARGVRAGNRVALLFPNDHRFIEALLAAMWLGAVAVPLNTRSGLTALRHVVSDSTATVLVAHSSLADEARGLADPVGIPVVLGGPENDWQESQAHRPPVSVADDDVCLQPYTSGSTGAPKGCLLTHGGQYWNASTVREVWKLDPSDRGLVTAPLYHKNALICVVKPLLLCGGTVVIGESPDPRDIPAEVERHSCTYMTGVPATYELLLDSGQHRSRDISSLRFAICGSAPLSREAGSRIAAGLGVPVLEAYGLTEGGPQVLMTPRDAEPRFGKAGIPMPGGEVRLLDIERMPAEGIEGLPELPVGSVGEMWIRNPGVTTGYFGLPEVTRQKLSVDGWFRTGDLAVRDADGWFQVLGRHDDMINVGGENVYPTEVETLLLGLPQVRQAVVVPVPHPRKGEVPVAFVRADGLTEEEVKQYCLAEGPAYAHPRRVWFIDELPLGGTGKLDRASLIRRATQWLAGSVEAHHDR